MKRKFQIPSTKFQINSNVRNSKRFGHLNFEFFWNLEFVIWNLTSVMEVAK